MTTLRGIVNPKSRSDDFAFLIVTSLVTIIGFILLFTDRGGWAMLVFGPNIVWKFWVISRMYQRTEVKR